MPGRPETVQLLRQRNFRLLLSAQSASVFGDRMFTVALAFAVLDAGGSASAVGLVLACGMAPLVGSLLIGGVVADRRSRRAVMVAADLVRVGSQGTMAALLIAGAPAFWMLGALAAVSGAATGFFNPASTALMPAVVEPDRLQQANGLRATAISGGEILGPLAAGVIVASGGAGWAVAIDAATFAISAALLLSLRDVGAATRAPSSFIDDLKGGWWDFRSRRWVWTLILSVGIGNMVWGAWSALGPVVANRDLGGAAAWGTVLAALGVGALAGSVIATRARPRRPLVWWSMTTLVFGLPLAFLAARAPVALLASSAFVCGAAMMLGNSVWASTLQRHIPDESLSRVAAYDWFGSLAFYPLGLAAFGPIAGVLGLSPTLWIAFAVQMATGLALLAVPDIRNLPASPETLSATSPHAGAEDLRALG